MAFKNETPASHGRGRPFPLYTDENQRRGFYLYMFNLLCMKISNFDSRRIEFEYELNVLGRSSPLLVTHILLELLHFILIIGLAIEPISLSWNIKIDFLIFKKIVLLLENILIGKILQTSKYVLLEEYFDLLSWLPGYSWSLRHLSLSYK